MELFIDFRVNYSYERFHHITLYHTYEQIKLGIFPKMGFIFFKYFCLVNKGLLP